MGRFVRAGGVILALALVALTLLLTSAVCISALLSLWHGHSYLLLPSLYTGLICGLLLWLFAAVFHLSRESLDMSIDGPDVFLDRARQVMNDLGYEVVFQSADEMLTRPGFYSLLFGGGVSIRVAGAHARIAGPKLMTELVRRRLRVQSHIDRAQQPIPDQRRRAGARLLKRVQIAIKLNPHQIDDVQRHVIEPLGEEGSVICMLTILAQSESGIRELGPTHPIRIWLEQQGLKADFHRDHVELSEPLQLTPYDADATPVVR